MDELAVLSFPDKESWASWLTDNHASAHGVWLKIAKKGTGIPTVTYAEAVELALCYGWIDGQRRGLDQDFFVQRFTPRRPRSNWSMINRRKAEELIRSGTMAPSGLAEVERARADGRWDRAHSRPSARCVCPGAPPG